MRTFLGYTCDGFAATRGNRGHDEAEGGPGRDVCVAEETEGC